MNNIKKMFEELYKYIGKKLNIYDLKIYYYDFYNNETKNKINKYLDYNLPLNDKTDENIKYFVTLYNLNLKNNDEKIENRESFINVSKNIFKKEIIEFEKIKTLIL